MQLSQQPADVMAMSTRYLTDWVADRLRNQEKAITNESRPSFLLCCHPRSHVHRAATIIHFLSEYKARSFTVNATASSLLNHNTYKQVVSHPWCPHILNGIVPICQVQIPPYVWEFQLLNHSFYIFGSFHLSSSLERATSFPSLFNFVITLLLLTGFPSPLTLYLIILTDLILCILCLGFKPLYAYTPACCKEQ